MSTSLARRLLPSCDCFVYSVFEMLAMCLLHPFPRRGLELKACFTRWNSRDLWHPGPAFFGLSFLLFLVSLFHVFTFSRCHVFTFLRFYVFTFLRFYVFTFLRFYVFTFLRFYVFTFLRFHVFTLFRFISVHCLFPTAFNNHLEGKRRRLGIKSYCFAWSCHTL
jgi:hypothetical protein